MDSYKHYIRKNEAGIIIHGFSSAFEQPQAGDLQLSGDQGRHFQIPLMTDRMQYKYKLVDGKMVARTQSELDTEWAAKPPSSPSLEERLSAAEEVLTALLGL